MKTLDLNKAAEEFETISDEHQLFYNIETGEFDFYIDPLYSGIENDFEKFEEDCWIAAPSQRDLNEYEIMSDFADSVTDLRKNELLSVALEGRGAFRRFKDTLNRIGLTDKWYKFKHNAYVELAREWCEENKIEYTGYTKKTESKMSPDKTRPEKIAVTMATIESHNHIIDDIERGVKIYNSGGVEFMEQEPNCYWVKVPHKGKDFKVVTLCFSRDGQDIDKFVCHCSMNYKNPPVCRHVVAAVLAIQGGVVESKLSLGKTASVSTTVTEDNTAKSVGSGDLDVFSTPMMIALMEQSARDCLADCLEKGQTSVGTEINVAHTAASPLGAKITATATIEYVFGRKVEFVVTASDKSGEIGKGKHTRFIVDTEQFIKKCRRAKVSAALPSSSSLDN